MAFGPSVRFIPVLAASCVLSVGCGPREADGPAATDPTPGPNQVSIFRDERGVPHIYALEEQDGFYGLGYALARDHLQRLLLGVLKARGEIAANVTPDLLLPQLRQMFPTVERMIESDHQAKLWRVHEFSREAIERLDTQLRRNYSYFAEGVEGYIESHPDRVPSWAPDDLSLADMVAYPHDQLWMAFQAGIGVNDCRRGGVETTAAKSSRSGAPRPYSNEWAIMPERTSTGGAILLSDPHGGIDGRFLYEFRLHAGRLDAAGYSFGPMLIVGRNERVGWGLTTGSPDVADCYRVEMLSDDNLSYAFDGEVKSVETREIVIGVKGEQPIRISAKYTHHNGVLSPVVAELPGTVYVVSTPYLNNLEGFHNTAYRMNLSKNVDELKESFRAGGYFPQNVLAADTNGHILYIHAGMVPVRPSTTVDRLRPVSGNTSQFAWEGIHSIDDLLIIRSPPAGYLQNNNVDPQLMDVPPPPETLGMAEYLLYGGQVPRGELRSRAYRAIQVLSSLENMSEEDAFALAFDVESVGSDTWLGMLKSAIEHGGRISDEMTQTQRMFLNDLLAFDGRLESSSTSALKYIYWREALREILAPADLEPLVNAFEGRVELTDALSRKFAQAVEDVAANLRMAAEGLERTYGDEFRLGGLGGASWPMSGGSLHPPRTTPRRPGVECAVSEMLCPTTLLAMYYGPPNAQHQRLAVAGSRIMRLDFYSPDGIRSFTVQNPGISDDPSSVHYDDQAQKLLSKRRMKPVHFDWQQLAPHVTSKKTLHVP